MNRNGCASRFLQLQLVALRLRNHITAHLRCHKPAGIGIVTLSFITMRSDLCLPVILHLIEQLTDFFERALVALTCLILVKVGHFHLELAHLQ